jgi:predicted MFS family arabinose efflux permease
MANLEERDLKPGDSYLNKLNAILPAEVTGLYLFIRNLAQNNRDFDYYLAAFALLIGITVFFVSPQLLKISDKATRILYAMTFLLWVCSIEISTIELRTNWPPIVFILTGLIAVWTFAVPYVFDMLKQKSTPKGAA